MKRSTTLLALMMLTACAFTPAIEPATLVLKGGTIVTVDRAKPEVQAIAIRGDTIAALGTNDETQADGTVLSKDIMTVPEEEIKSAQVTDRPI